MVFHEADGARQEQMIKEKQRPLIPQLNTLLYRNESYDGRKDKNTHCR
jgi:hypothetical protein